MEDLSGTSVGIRRRSQTERASKLSQRQFGAIARRQLLAVGFSPSRVDRWLREGRLHPKYPGVYAWGRGDLAEEGQLAAALLLAGKGAALDGISGLWWRGLLHRRPGLVHVASPGSRSSTADVLIRHPRNVTRETCRDLPVTPLPAALLASTAHLAHDSLRLVLARAEFSRQLSLRSLQASFGRGVAGSPALRAAMDAHLPALAACANDFERSFVLLCEAHRVPIPEPNTRMGRYRPDMLWREQRLIVELDGHDAHFTPAQLIHDADRQAKLERNGYRVIRFSWEEVTFEPERVAERVREALGAAGAS